MRVLAIRYDCVPLDTAFLVVMTGSDSGEEVVSGEKKYNVSHSNVKYCIEFTILTHF